jgi:hypothetical protein
MVSDMRFVSLNTNTELSRSFTQLINYWIELVDGLSFIIIEFRLGTDNRVKAAEIDEASSKSKENSTQDPVLNNRHFHSF